MGSAPQRQRVPLIPGIRPNAVPYCALNALLKVAPDVDTAVSGFAAARAALRRPRTLTIGLYHRSRQTEAGTRTAADTRCLAS